MADRKVTVVNPAGYQEQLPDSDNLLLAAAPTIDFHAVNKLYVDTGLANIDFSDIEADIDQLETDLGLLTTRVTTLEGQVAQEISDRDGREPMIRLMQSSLKVRFKTSMMYSKATHQHWVPRLVVLSVPISL